MDLFSVRIQYTDDDEPDNIFCVFAYFQKRRKNGLITHCSICVISFSIHD